MSVCKNLLKTLQNLQTLVSARAKLCPDGGTTWEVTKIIIAHHLGTVNLFLLSHDVTTAKNTVSRSHFHFHFQVQKTILVRFS